MSFGDWCECPMVKQVQAGWLDLTAPALATWRCVRHCMRRGALAARWRLGRSVPLLFALARGQTSSAEYIPSLLS